MNEVLVLAQGSIGLAAPVFVQRHEDERQNLSQRLYGTRRKSTGCGGGRGEQNIPHDFSSAVENGIA
jgi:hypothetical protein